jgi:HK97 family phage major capsid protein
MRFSDLPARERAKYSLINGIRDALNKGDGLERQVTAQHVRDHQLLDPNYGPSGECQLIVPRDFLGQAQRATSTTAGTGEHLVNQIHGEFAPLVDETLGLAKAGCTTLTGLRGTVKLPGADAMLDADQVSEVANQTDDDEQTFRVAYLVPKRYTSRVTFSRELLNCSSPSVDALLAKLLRRRAARAAEREIILDLFANDDVQTTDDNTITGTTLNGMVDLVSGAGGLCGPVSFVAPRAVISHGLNNPRLTDGTAQMVQSFGSGRYEFDGQPFCQSDKIASVPDAESPSTLVPGVLAGCFEALLVGEHFGALDVIVDQYTEAAKNSIVLWINQYISSAVCVPEALCKMYVDPESLDG